MIKNLTQKTVIAQKEKIITSIFGKAIGLMFSPKIEDFGLIFSFSSQKKVDLHMFFVFFAIDVIYLDGEKNVLEIKENFRPFTFYSPEHTSFYVIELVHGAVKASKTQVGDKISF